MLVGRLPFAGGSADALYDCILERCTPGPGSELSLNLLQAPPPVTANASGAEVAGQGGGGADEDLPAVDPDGETEERRAVSRQQQRRAEGAGIGCGSLMQLEWLGLSESALSFVSRLLCIDPSRRLGAKGAFDCLRLISERFCTCWLALMLSCAHGLFRSRLHVRHILY